MPDEICNKAFQPKGSGYCGQVVIHWCDEAARRCIGEGPMANGFPDPGKWTQRIQTVVDQIIKNAGVSKVKLLKTEKKKEELDKKAADAIELISKIATDLQLQNTMADAAESADFKYGSWGSSGGCPKCRQARFGSTCCNPDKIEAKKRAEQILADREPVS